MRSNRMRTTLLVALVLTLWSVPPASAGSSKSPVEWYMLLCIEDPGIQWIAGNTLHTRGVVSQGITYDTQTFEVVGENSQVLNANFNFNTGQVVWWAVFSLIYLPESETGTFDGTLNGKNAVGQAVGHGKGELTGKKLKGDIFQLDSTEVPPEIWDILSQPPWTECGEFGGIYLNTGLIHSRGGN